MSFSWSMLPPSLFLRIGWLFRMSSAVSLDGSLILFNALCMELVSARRARKWAKDGGDVLKGESQLSEASTAPI